MYCVKYSFDSVTGESKVDAYPWEDDIKIIRDTIETELGILEINYEYYADLNDVYKAVKLFNHDLYLVG